MRSLLWSTACVISAACLLLTPSLTYAQGRDDGGGDRLESALSRGDYQLARQLALRHDDPPSLIARARFAERDGQMREARRFAELAMQKATRSDHERRAVVALASLEFEMGERGAAERRLRAALKEYPDDAGIRFTLGDVLWRQGKLADAEPILDYLSRLFNNGKLTTSTDLTYLGRAMRLLGQFDDANYAFKKGHEADMKDPDVLVHWGELFLEKYSVSDAEQNFKEALALNPRHPRALIGAAVTRMVQSNQTDEIRQMFARVAKVAPAHPELYLARAHLAIRDGNCPVATEAADALLADRPKHQDGLTILAICAYLDDDEALYTSYKDKILDLNPTNANALAEVGDYGVMNHRYVEAMEVYRQALRIDSDNARALLGLGIGLSRLNREDEALEYLQRAFDVDPYNVRAYNMLELYEKTMPSYSFKEEQGFKLRAHNDQFGMVDTYVTPVIEEALEIFTDKYGYDPDDDLAVEIYPDPTTFSVRSLGMPHISPHGICFGHVVTVRSPSDGNFNWRQVVWHELAHVYHLQMSNSRVPRWFTEGLAEYETNVHDPAWQRHHDREIAAMVWDGEIPTVLKLDYGFTHAGSQREVVQAYHLASLAIHYIAETHGFDKIVAMLKEWGRVNDTKAVLQNVLGVTPEQFDKGFVRWLKRRLMEFEVQLVVEFPTLDDLEDIERRIKLNARDVRARADLALIQAQQGELKKAQGTILDALSINKEDPKVLFTAMLIAMRQSRIREARAYGESILGLFKDSYQLRVFLGHAAMMTEDLEGARVHFRAATELYGGGAEAWLRLRDIASAQKDVELVAEATHKLFTLNQHDPGIAEAMFEIASARGEEALAWEALRRWLDTNPFDARVHRHIVAFAEERDGFEEELGRAWRSLVLLRPGDKEALYREAIASLRAAGEGTQANALIQRAKDEGIALD